MSKMNKALDIAIIITFVLLSIVGFAKEDYYMAVVYTLMLMAFIIIFIKKQKIERNNKDV